MSCCDNDTQTSQNTYTKRPAEVRWVQAELGPLLSEGETLDSIVSVTPQSGSGLEVDDEEIIDTKVKFKLSAGTVSDEDYHVAVIVNTLNEGDEGIVQGDCVVRVREFE